MSTYSAPRPIRSSDHVADFSSGELSLDHFLRVRALANHASGASRVFVTARDDRVVGYYALASAAIARGTAPGRVRRNMPDPIPAILLSRLAVDLAEQHSGLGRGLLRDAITRSVDAADLIGVRAILVHALNDDVRAFNLRAGFTESPTNPLHLLLLIGDARASISAPD